MKDEERGYVLLTHLFAAIPLWGILFNGIIWISFQEKSRKVVFHAHQGIFFQVAFLAMTLVGLLVFLFAQLVGVINESIASLIRSGNWLVIVILFILYEITCIYAIWNVIQGRDFEYPFIGSKLRENSGNAPPKDHE
ncbi:DUF4870 domain-containing protein [Candidatus Sumerlaeota bacterium]|nr:DUF4870 domain-containing protein [Candidatus Sumerlaeota bacterium]